VFRYLIGWTNGVIAIGFIINPETNTLPVICQFGDWKTKEQHDLRTGSVVLVREVAQLLSTTGNYREMTTVDGLFHKMFSDGKYLNLMPTYFLL
jgi:hypothetical protein